MLRKERKVIIITGKSGTGKTKLAKQIIPFFKRRIVLDVLEEYTCEKTFNSLQEFLDQTSVLDQSINACIRGFKENEIDFICEWVLIAGNICLVVEEFETYVSRYENFKYLDEIIRRGRHNDVSLIAISQRVPDFPPLFRSQITSFFSFYQDEPTDVKHLLDRDFQLEDIESLERCEGVQRPEQNVHYLSKGDTVEEIKEWTDGTEKNYLQSQTKDFQL